MLNHYAKQYEILYTFRIASNELSFNATEYAFIFEVPALKLEPLDLPQSWRTPPDLSVHAGTSFGGRGPILTNPPSTNEQSDDTCRSTSKCLWHDGFRD